jgi:hypothetical protein
MNEQFENQNKIELTSQEQELVAALDGDINSPECLALLDAWQQEQQKRRDENPSGALDVGINIHLAQPHIVAKRKTRAWDILSDAREQALNEGEDVLLQKIESIMDEMES